MPPVSPKSHTEQVRELLDHLQTVTSSPAAAEEASKTIRERGYAPEVMADALSRIWGGEPGLTNTEAYRQVLIFQLEARLARDAINTQVRLSRSATLFGWAAIGLAAVGAVAACIEVLDRVHR